MQWLVWFVLKRDSVKEMFIFFNRARLWKNMDKLEIDVNIHFIRLVKIAVECKATFTSDIEFGASFSFV